MQSNMHTFFSASQYSTINEQSECHTMLRLQRTNHKDSRRNTWRPLALFLLQNKIFNMYAVILEQQQWAFQQLTRNLQYTWKLKPAIVTLQHSPLMWLHQPSRFFHVAHGDLWMMVDGLSADACWEIVLLTSQRSTMAWANEPCRSWNDQWSCCKHHWFSNIGSFVSTTLHIQSTILWYYKMKKHNVLPRSPPLDLDLEPLNGLPQNRYGRLSISKRIFWSAAIVYSQLQLTRRNLTVLIRSSLMRGLLNLKRMHCSVHS